MKNAGRREKNIETSARSSSKFDNCSVLDGQIEELRRELNMMASDEYKEIGAINSAQILEKSEEMDQLALTEHKLVMLKKEIIEKKTAPKNKE